MLSVMFRPSFYSVGSGVLCSGVKRPERDVYNSPPSSDEGRNE
jgi:hypothetical protein